jgi:hypothetical protein
MSTCGERTAVVRVRNCLLVFTANATYVVASRRKPGIRGFMGKFIIKAATALDAFSGAVDSLYDRVTGLHS